MDIFNTWWIYLLVGIILLYVLVQSFYFLYKAVTRAKQLGFTKSQISKTISSSMIFSIAPSIAILLGLVVLSKIFGPWVAGLRLGTLGAVTYELPAAINVIEGAYHLNIGDVLPSDAVVTALWVMTLGCIPPLLIVPFFYKKLSVKFDDIKARDQKWKDIMMDALFLGMISAFVGYVVAPIESNSGSYISVLAIAVLLSSALLIILFGVLLKFKGLKWLKNYALPLSMIASMALAIVYASWGLK